MNRPTVDTAIIFSPDYRKLAQFYQEGLGLGPPTVELPDHIGYQLTGLYLGFDHIEEPLGKGAGTTLWFRVDDISATFEHLQTLGATVRYPPTSKPFGETLAALYDPDGNMVGLSQRKDDEP